MKENKIKKIIEYGVRPFTNVKNRKNTLIDRFYFILPSPIELKIGRGTLKIGITNYMYFNEVFKIIFDFSNLSNTYLGEIITDSKRIYDFFKKEEILRTNKEYLTHDNLMQYIFLINNYYALDFAIKKFRKFDCLRIFSTYNKEIPTILKILERSFLFLEGLSNNIFDLCNFVLFFEEIGDCLIIEGKHIPVNLYNIVNNKI